LSNVVIEFAGLSGTGKSSLLRELCCTFGYPQSQISKKLRIVPILNLLPFGFVYLIKSDPKLRKYAINALKRTYNARQFSVGTYCLDEGIFSYFSHISKNITTKNNFILKSSRRGGVLPDGLILFSCDSTTRVDRIRKRAQGCLDLALDDQANIAKSENWGAVWRARTGPLQEAGVDVFHVDTSKSTIAEAAETVHNWILDLEERLAQKS